MHPKHLSVSDFTYELPPGRIAQQPAEVREESKLLIYNNGNIEIDGFKTISNYLPADSTIVFNDTKVIHARILFKNENDATIEIFLLEPVKPFSDMQLAMFQRGDCTWRCFIGNARKWRSNVLDRKIRVNEEKILLEIRQEGKIEDDFLVHFSWTPADQTFAKILEAAGHIPLPPYIKRKAGGEDEQRYQTVYAFQDGSVAAPTAGLHFSEKIFKDLREKNIHQLFVTLHVSAGTFLPVKSETMEGHHMHGEQFVVTKNLVEFLISKQRQPVIAVGTTSARTLESLYWLGRQFMEGNYDLQVSQWEPYETEDQQKYDTMDCLTALLHFMEKKKLNQLVANTKILIAPGYRFRIINGLVTNFHLPQSTLLLLIAAFIGDDWKKVYEYALQHDLRFLSYGDASLLWRKETDQ
jgi:S-adenosylmethionine:tRNA ribosyltransferase-isomerase